MFVLLRETTFTISDSIEAGSPVESETVRVVSLSIKEITKIARFRKETSFHGPNTVNFKFVFGRVENIVRKGENAGYQHFLLFSQCF